MKNFKIFALIIVIVLIGALGYVYYVDNKITKEETPPVVVKDSALGCYVAKLAKDVYTLEIQSENNGKVSGIIAFNNYEKDSSSGTFEGTFSGDILLGNYSFDSEGMHSNRQLIFKKVDGNFIEGFGEAKIVGDTETFNDINTISYDSKSTFVKSENCKEAFTAPDSSLSFKYDPFFQVISGYDFPSTDWQLNSKQKGTMLAQLSIPKSYMPQTNFSGTKLTIGKSADATAIKNCIIDTSNFKGGTITISGFPFTKFLYSDAGAGNFYATTSYRGIVGGSCYSVEYTIHSTNIGNYSPDQNIKEFDKTKIINDVESIVKSLKLTVVNK